MTTRAPGPRLLDGLLQDGDAARAEALEERALRLEHGDPVGQRLDDGAAEPLQPDVVVQAPVGEQGGVRVDAHAQRAALVHGAAQPGAEGFGLMRPSCVGADRVGEGGVRARTQPCGEPLVDGAAPEGAPRR